MANDAVTEELPAKYPSKLLLLVVAFFIVLGPFTTPNGLWFCWSLSASLTYIYINMSLKWKRWEKEQMEKNKKKESKKQK